MLKTFKKKEKKKETVVEFLLSVLCCWFVSIGTGLIVDAQFSFQIGFNAILWQTLFAIVASVLFTRRWWIPIIYFGILVPVFFLAISLSGDINTFFESFMSFVEWWLSGMSYDSKWYSDQGFYLVHIFMNVGIGILYFAVARIFKKSLVVVAVALGFIVFNYASGYTGYSLWAIPFLVAGVFPLVAGEKFQKVKLPDIKNLFGVWGKKSLLMIVATLVVAAISVLSFGVATNTQDSVRNRICSDTVADLQTVSNVYTKEQKKLNLTLFDLGLVMNSTYIGGNLYNIEPKTLAATSLTEESLVKMTSFDTFDGVMWTNSFEKSYRVNGLWNDEQNTYLAGSAVSNSEFLEKASNSALRTKVTITLSSKSSFLPILGQVIGFSESTETINPVLFDKRGRLLSYYGFETGYSYTIDTLVYNTEEKALNKKIKSMINSLNLGTDAFYDEDSELYKSYTQLPSEIPEELEEALKKLSLEDETEYERAYKIREYFSSENGFVYAREPNNFERGDNIIERLFATKKGHCMYYATAMVIMARSVGVPSRLVAGYKTVQNPNGKLQVIDVSSPYAWVECYIPNIGWLTFDPTPETAVKPDNTNKNQITLGQQSVVPDIQVDVDVEEEEKKVAGTHLKWKNVFNVPLIVFLSLVLLVIICVVLNAIFSPRFYQIESVRKRFSSTKAQAEYYYIDILRQFSWLGFKLRKGETLSELTARVCSSLPSNYVQAVLDAIKIVEELHYGDISPTDEGVESVFIARTQLEKVLIDRNNRISYILKRRLCLTAFCSAVKKYK